MTMQKTGPLGIKGIAALHRAVFSLEENRQFLSDTLDFEEIAVSGPAWEERMGERSMLFRAGECLVVCSEPLRDDSPAGRYLKRHPEGIAAISYEVTDVHATLKTFEARGGTPVTDVCHFEHAGGNLEIFSAATPLDDVRFHFCTRQDHVAPLPGFVMHDAPKGGTNRFGISTYDHITTNFQTMEPMVAWLDRVMGFTRIWDIEFHTQDILGAGEGSGLKSIVMWDETSGIKIPANEPMRPNWEESQVALYCHDQRGNGIQHAALHVDGIYDAVRELKERGVHFTHAPGAYYDAVPARLAEAGVGAIPEDMARMRELEILVDGTAPGKYLLQTFMEDAARFEGDLKKSPFFFELIERKGCPGFGAGNFRALFEGVELAQRGRTHHDEA